MATRLPRLLAALALSLSCAAASPPPPTSWPDAPAGRAWWPELGGLPLWAPPPLALAAPGLALAASPDFSYAALAIITGIDISAAAAGGGGSGGGGAGAALSAAWTTPAVVPGYASADYWPTLASPQPLLLAAGGAVAVTGATLRSTPQSPPSRAAIGLVGVSASSGAQAWSWALPAPRAAQLVTYAVAPGASSRVQVLFTFSTNASTNALLVVGVDAATGVAAQDAPWNVTALGALAGCNATAVTNAGGFVVSADGTTALITASYAPYSWCLVAIDLDSSSALWSAPAAQAPAWEPVADPADASQAFVWLGPGSGSPAPPLTLAAVGLRDGGRQRWAAALPANESAIVGLSVAAGYVFVAATFSSGCPVGLVRVYAFNAATGALAGAPFNYARYPDVGAEGALKAVATGGADGESASSGGGGGGGVGGRGFGGGGVGGGGVGSGVGGGVGGGGVGGGGVGGRGATVGASAIAVVYLRGTGTRDAAEGLDSFLAALSFDGRSFALAHESTGAATGVGVAGTAQQCRRGDAGYAPSGSLLVAGAQLLLADAGGVVVLGGVGGARGA